MRGTAIAAAAAATAAAACLSSGGGSERASGEAEGEAESESEGDSSRPRLPPRSDGGASEGEGESEAEAEGEGEGESEAEAEAEVEGQYLDPCDSGADCASGPCAETIGGGICTRPCARPEDCAADHGCYDIGGVRLCLPIDVGRPCEVGAGSGCESPYCHGPAGGDGYCTGECAAARDCPAGYTCSTLNGSGDPPRICTRVDETCAGGAEECSSGLCLGDDRCVGDCRDARDCPPDHRCEDLRPVDACVPDSDGSRGLDDPCTSPAQCRSGLCAGYCTAPCGVTRGAGQPCPPGMGCIPVDDGEGGFALVCERAGAGGFGDPCGDNEDCASGVCLSGDEDPDRRYCSRFCNDGLCPTGAACEEAGVTASGVALRACAIE